MKTVVEVSGSILFTMTGKNTVRVEFMYHGQPIHLFGEYELHPNFTLEIHNLSTPATVSVQ